MKALQTIIKPYYAMKALQTLLCHESLTFCNLIKDFQVFSKATKFKLGKPFIRWSLLFKAFKAITFVTFSNLIQAFQRQKSNFPLEFEFKSHFPPNFETSHLKQTWLQIVTWFLLWLEPKSPSFQAPAQTPRTHCHVNNIAEDHLGCIYSMDVWP